uniref:Ancillary SecYEG translocon subunit n=1 Tax=Candidatus Kentrum sp. FM TaxID=2126340 RepID=A0A450VXD3_9GAMM|nr:MAG: Putative negative regulator of RcsB-dependent stress response [Candidatus Kentron sp. FM]VFJ63108.1 MAG: Putative negative regulator of RcsB-dependent stress response [Candidatus Kentron sp. FM]VFK09473.1 MAG: Putative negative regulator of RcsB-dependent stress response [Candidatus Kentron sp. FM]
MNTYESEQEQLEALQKWWKENGRAVISGIALGAVVIIGWSSWQVYTTQQAEKASLHYDRLLASARDSSYEQTIEQGNFLVEELPTSGYAALAALVTAKAAFRQHDMQKAKTYLQLAIDQKKSEAVQRIARLRLARLLMDEKKWDDAMALLDGDAGEFADLYEEARGDIFLARGDSDEARSAYERVLAGGKSQVRVRMKLDDLGSGEINN